LQLRLRTALALDAASFDLQAAWRSLLNGGWFTSGAVLTLSLGIGAASRVRIRLPGSFRRSLSGGRADPATLGLVIVILLISSAVAAWLPAHRAARFDPGCDPAHALARSAAGDTSFVPVFAATA
jgi:hypothetical protein